MPEKLDSTYIPDGFDRCLLPEDWVDPPHRLNDSDLLQSYSDKRHHMRNWLIIGSLGGMCIIEGFLGFALCLDYGQEIQSAATAVMIGAGTISLGSSFVFIMGYKDDIHRIIKEVRHRNLSLK